MQCFRIPRDRDAWFVIRGYRYQIDLTILRWLSLSDDQELHLECGEDIDLVNNGLTGSSDEFDRELEQVKHLDTTITLRTPACKVAVVNALRHKVENPSLNILFRFCTNSTATTERPSLFDDRAPGITAWTNIREGLLPETESATRCAALLKFYQHLVRPSEGIDDTSWSIFVAFIARIGTTELAAFIGDFEWSLGQPSADDVSVTIVHALIARHNLSSEHSKALYPRLFVHVMRVLSRSGPKSLDTTVLKKQVRLPQLSDDDTRLVNLLRHEVLTHSRRLDVLEARADHSDQLMTEVQQRIATEFGGSDSVALSAALTPVSTELPPVVATACKRSKVVSGLTEKITSNDWVALYGSMGCGKTQLASLIGENLLSSVYVSFRDLETEQAEYHLHRVLSQLAGEASGEDIAAMALSRLGTGAALFLDDLPRIVHGDALHMRLVALAKIAHSKQQTVITLSHHRIPSDVASSMGTEGFWESKLPEMVSEDVRELFLAHGAPEERLTSTVTASFAYSTAGNPTLLVAIGRALHETGWATLDEQSAKAAQAANLGEVVQDTMARLLKTVESEQHRDLLYRLCIILGSFTDQEVRAVANVVPAIERPTEAYSRLMGLWIEYQTTTSAVVCPLVRHFGADELSEDVARGVARSLAKLIVEASVISPLQFGQAIQYFRRADDVTHLATHVFFGLSSTKDLPVAWHRLVLLATSQEGLFEGCPAPLALLIRAKQISLAHFIGESTVSYAAEARRLVATLGQDEMWAAVPYALECGPILAHSDFEEGIRLLRLALESRDLMTLPEIPDEDVEELGASGDMYSVLPWLFVGEINTASEFEKWFAVLTTLPTDQLHSVFDCDIAQEGFRFVLDRLWMDQHERVDRTFDAILRAYDNASMFFHEKALPVCEALVVRSQIIVHAEYLSDLPRASALALNHLEGHESEESSNEVSYLIHETLGRQYLYASDRDNAIVHLEAAVAQPVDAFHGLRCRTFLHLSEVIGDDDSRRAASLAETAIDIAKQHPREVAELDLITALGEAAVAFGLMQEYGSAFKNIEQAFLVLSQQEDKSSVEWKMRYALLGAWLGYFTSMASYGSPPEENYVVPMRGKLLGHNALAADWFDEQNYSQVDLTPTLLTTFANAVGDVDRAVFWANRGIDDARRSGVLACIGSLAEALVPTLIKRRELEQAFDYAEESVIAVYAAVEAAKAGHYDIRVGLNADEMLGTKPSDLWNQIEDEYILRSVVPAIVNACVEPDRDDDALKVIEDYLVRTSSDASDDKPFHSLVDSIRKCEAGGSHQEVLAVAFDGAPDNWTCDRVGALFLASFSDNNDSQSAIIEHAVAMHVCSTRIQLSSPIWAYLTKLLFVYWKRIFTERKFLFRNPQLLEADLATAETEDIPIRVKALIRRIISGLGVGFPPQLNATKEWLSS